MFPCFPKGPAFALAAFLAAGGPAKAADPALTRGPANAVAPLTLEVALSIAERESPMLAARLSDLASAREDALPAAALPDPKLITALDNFPVTGPERGLFDRDFMTMQRVGLMQEVPNRARRRARVGIADAAVAQRESDLAVARVQVRREAARAWLALWSLQKRQDMFDDLARENQLFSGTIAAQVESGRAEPSDGVGPALEATQLADRRDVLAQEIARARAMLGRYVGTAAEAPLPDAAPPLEVQPERLRTQLEDLPELLAFGAATQRAQAELDEAVAAREPDWSVEVGYQRRGGQFGDMVSVQFSFDLPIARSERQDPRIAARRSALARVDADREALRREQASELVAGVAEWEALGRQLVRARAQVVPLADHKVDLMLASYGAGKARLSDVLQARRERVEQRLRVLELEGARQQAAARLLFVHEEERP